MPSPAPHPHQHLVDRDPHARCLCLPPTHTNTHAANRTSSSFDETKARKLLKKALEQSGVKVARLDSQAPGGSSDGTGRLSSNGGAGGSQANRPIKALPKKFDSIRASSGGGAGASRLSVWFRFVPGPGGWP